jgi:hypothetical protein
VLRESDGDVLTADNEAARRAAGMFEEVEGVDVRALFAIQPAGAAPAGTDTGDSR